MHGIEEVVARDMCIGCGVCEIATRRAITVRLSPRGIYEADLSRADREALLIGSAVCPFSDAATNEDELGKSRFGEHGLQKIDGLGLVRHAAIGRRTSESELIGSSSGGLTSWLAETLLERGEVDEVVHVAPDVNDGGLFAYTSSGDTATVEARRKSQYYATTMAGVLGRIRESQDVRFALIGVPCYIKSAQLLAKRDPRLDGKIRYYVGLVCGHMKTRAFAEALAWQSGIRPDELAGVDFRVKNPGRSSADYDVTSWATDGRREVRRTRDLLGGNWGHGAFQPEACNFCDDIFAETADVVFGDAWLPEFNDDWRGHNVVIVREPRILDLFRQGTESGQIVLREIEPGVARATQAGAFRHRVDGLRVRLSDDLSRGLSVPRKRVSPATRHVSRRRRRLIRYRRQMSRLSIEAFANARATGELDLFMAEMRTAIAVYQRMETPAWRRYAGRARRLIRAWLRH